MTHKALFTSKLFPHKQPKAVIFFGCPFGRPIKTFEPFIRNIRRQGFTVVAYDFADEIFYGGKPAYMLTLIEQMQQEVGVQIKHFQAQGITEFGFCGNSVGSFVFYNVLAAHKILRWGVCNTAGNITKAAWQFPQARHAFEANGFTEQSLAKAWESIQFPDFGGDRTGTYYLYLGSDKDNLVPYSEMETYAHALRASGATVDIKRVRARNHNSAILQVLIRTNHFIRKARKRTNK